MLKNQTINGVKIKEELIKINYTKGFKIKPKYIVIHSINAARFWSLESYLRFVSTNSKAKESIHYLVSDNKIVQLLEDDQRSIHIKNIKSGIVSNSNSISIAIVLRNNMDSREVFNNLVCLVKLLREKHNISFSNVIRHYDINGENCPEELVQEYIWHNFKMMISGLKIERKPIGIGKIYGVLTSLNLKEYPREDSIAIGQVKSNSEFYIYEDKNGWLETIIQGENGMIKGYLAKDFVEYKEVDDNILFGEDDEDISDEEDESSDSIYRIEEDQIDLNEVNDSNSECIYPKNIQEDTNGENDNIKLKSRFGVIDCKEINLGIRSGASEKHFVVSYIFNNENVEIINEEGDWYEILYNSSIGKKSGFINKKYIKLI